MGSFKKQVFNSKELAVLDLAFSGALATLDELGLERGGLEEKLRQTLFIVAAEGVTDPEILRNELLQTIGVNRL